MGIIIIFKEENLFYLNINGKKVIIFRIIPLIIIIIIILIFEYKIQYYIMLDSITHKENFISKTKALGKGKVYLDQCLKGILINKNKFQISKNPKVTVIIPLYNSGKFIKLIIRSVQNHNIDDIEIILINDFSNDNGITLQAIKQLKQEDQRIIIINNRKNMGILYSRCIGVLQSRGEYIMNLDHDDFIFDENIFDTSYKSAKIGKFDIISFTYVISEDYKFEINESPYINIHIIILLHNQDYPDIQCLKIISSLIMILQYGQNYIKMILIKKLLIS